MLLTCWSLHILWKRLQAEVYVKQVVECYRQANWNVILQLYPGAVNPYYVMDNFSIPVVWYAGVAHSGRGEDRAALQCFREAYRIHPYQLHVINNLAGTFERMGLHDSAVYYYDQGLAITPKQTDILLNRAAALYNAGRITAAYKAIIQFPGDPENIQSHIYLKAIVPAYLEQQVERGDTTLNAPFVQTLIQYPDTIKYYYLKFSANNVSFDTQIHLYQSVAP